MRRHEGAVRDLRIDLTVFIVATDQNLEPFVARRSDISHGRAFRADLGSLDNRYCSVRLTETVHQGSLGDWSGNRLSTGFVSSSPTARPSFV